MSDLRKTPASIATPSRSEFLKKLALANVQFDADNRKEAVDLYMELEAAAPEAAEAAEHIFICRRLGECYAMRSEHEAALHYLQKAEVQLASHPMPVEQGWVLSARGGIAIDEARFADAERYLVAAHDLLKDESDHAAFGKVERRLGKLYLRMGRLDEARSRFESALATFRRSEDMRGVAGSLNNLGVIHRLACEWGEAVRVMEHGLRLNETLADEGHIGALCVNLGVVHVKLGQWQRAEERFERAAASMGRTGNRRGVANARLGQAGLALRQWRYDDAQAFLDEALAIAKSHSLVRTECLCHELLGELELERGNLEAAGQVLLRGMAIARSDKGSKELVAEVARRLALVHLASGDAGQARRLAEEALELNRQVADVYEETLCLGALALIAGVQGDAQGMERFQESSVNRLLSFGDRYDQAQLLIGVGDAWANGRNALGEDWVAKARHAYHRAETLFIALELAGPAADAALKQAELEALQGRLDQALNRLDALLGHLPESEVALRERLAEQRQAVEDAMALGFGSASTERQAFEKVHKLYGDPQALTDVLAELLALVKERASAERAFFAWGAPDGPRRLIVADGFTSGAARQVMGAVDGAVAPLVEAERSLVASNPAHDARLAQLPKFVLESASAVAIVPFRIAAEVEGYVYTDRGEEGGAFQSADLAALAMLTNVVAIAAIESERLRVARTKQARPELAAGLQDILTGNDSMIHVLKLVERVADTPARVLIEGETGTGKGLLARAIHRTSPRADEPFVQVNCAALPEPLLESELFGHVQGAFTGAVKAKRGLFETAGEGTIFLDEVDKTSITLQGKLLHVLDRQEVRPVGDTAWRQVSCRVVAATNVSLFEKIEKGEFLEDLYYRLNEFSLTVPPLRERPDDIMLLARHFMALASERMGKFPSGIDPELEERLVERPWPGNVRELEKTIERLVVLSEDGRPLTVDLLPTPPKRSARRVQDELGVPTLKAAVQQLEARMIGDTLRGHGYNKLRTSKTLKISYPTLLKKIREYDLDRKPAEQRNGRTNRC